MIIKEEIKQELIKADVRLDKISKNLKKFEEGENDRKWLNKGHWKQRRREYAYGILTDTNFSIANLTPLKNKDSSVREYDHNIHKPFIYIVIQDCLSDIDQIPHDKDISTYDIIQFDRPFWVSNWIASKHLDNQFKFRDVINLAKAKLLGSTSSWNIALSIALELVRAHMVTLITIDKNYENYIITYPFEPILSEASLELIILNTSTQGELAVRLLLLNA
ncbi:13303_t:CDS:2 [Funneliformis mosseae]|uniref:13303_t:CDS:1 n=1 Tax=Funneliformis mosseae TaxID=27381 RepID=A0A9N9AKK2_FUNMO|nr:13303_t:CDS:2 [Funneliformis mosseae]